MGTFFRRLHFLKITLLISWQQDCDHFLIFKKPSSVISPFHNNESRWGFSQAGNPCFQYQLFFLNNTIRKSLSCLLLYWFIEKPPIPGSCWLSYIQKKSSLTGRTKKKISSFYANFGGSEQGTFMKSNTFLSISCISVLLNNHF